MNSSEPYKPVIRSSFHESDLRKAAFLVVMHATRIPPHIGLILDRHYHSLSIKGHDNTPADALLRNIMQRKIPSLFVALKPHDTFSQTYLREHFMINVQQFPRVEAGLATCLSPVKLFFEEVYGLEMKDINFLYELLPALERAGIAGNISGLFVEEGYSLPYYTKDEIMDGIRKARAEAGALIQ